MAAGVPLSQLITDLRHEAGQSATLALGQQTRDRFKHLLNRVQRELWVNHQWPVQQIERDVGLLAGVRYYAYPNGLAFDGIQYAWVRNGTEWLKLGFGIGPDELSFYNSEENFRSWPIAKWDHVGETNMIEVWPVPNQSGTMRMQGRKTLVQMVEESDVCQLDGDLIVFYAAAEILAEQKSQRANLMLEKAKAILARIKATQSGDKLGNFGIGMGSNDRARARVGIDYMPMKGTN
jgi:hypothetical protein